MKETGSETVFDGRLATVRIAKFLHEDGEEVTREIVGHPGAVAVVVHDGTDLILVRQPREAIDDPSLLELPAGKLEPDEPPLETAKRELAEEIGKKAEHWEHLRTYWSSPGFSDEEIHVYLATGLSDEHAEVDENERIEIVRHPLAELDALIDEITDGKSIIGLLEFRRRHGTA